VIKKIPKPKKQQHTPPLLTNNTIPRKLILKKRREGKTFPEKQKPREFITTRSA
jgi:hypothetical protein